MKNILAVEIKDNKTIVTVAKVQARNYNLLLHKSYNSKPLNTETYYDSDIINEIVNDLKQMNIFNDIDEKYLTINTNRVTITTMNMEYKYNTDLDQSKEQFRQHILRNNKTAHINELIFSKENDISLTKQNITATVEAMHSDYINQIEKEYKQKGIEFTKVIPIMRTIQNATSTKAISDGITISILIEEKFTQLTWIDNGVITSSIKWATGLTDIYQHISNMMNIKKPAAKKLFKSFGSIPPEDVVDDKVIHTRKEGKEMEVFTKKDLSRFITEKVNELFSNVKYHIEKLKNDDNQIRIIFNGEIKTLMGFKKYASKSFNEPNIKKFKTNIIGLNPETEFITMGILLEVEDNLETKKKDKLYSPKVNLLNKVFRMYNYI